MHEVEDVVPSYVFPSFEGDGALKLELKQRTKDKASCAKEPDGKFFSNDLS